MITVLATLYLQSSNMCILFMLYYSFVYTYSNSNCGSLLIFGSLFPQQVDFYSHLPLQSYYTQLYTTLVILMLPQDLLILWIYWEICNDCSYSNNNNGGLLAFCSLFPQQVNLYCHQYTVSTHVILMLHNDLLISWI